MIVVIKIQDVWDRYGDDSRVLKSVGIKVEEAVRLAYGFAALSCLPNCPRVDRCDIISAVYNLLRPRRQHIEIVDAAGKLERRKRRHCKEHITRLPHERQPGYGHNDPEVFRIVDLIGEVSRMLADAVIQQLGAFPPQLRLQRFIGPDLVLYLNED